MVTTIKQGRSVYIFQDSKLRQRTLNKRDFTEISILNCQSFTFFFVRIDFPNDFLRKFWLRDVRSMYLQNPQISPKNPSLNLYPSMSIYREIE